MNLNRKQLQERTAIPPATLTWLLKRLNIEPVEITKTLFGRPIYWYDDSVMLKLNEWLQNALYKREAIKAGKIKCRRCGDYCSDTEMISVYCKACYCHKVLMNLLTHNKPWTHPIDVELYQHCIDLLSSIKPN